MAPVIKELCRYTDQVRPLVCVTAQHREMLDQVLGLFDIQPDFDLNIMQQDQSLCQVTARLVRDLESVVQETRPDWILVQGDTSTAFVGSLVAFYHQVRVAHIEAGLRTGNKTNPFPEEMNRRFADVLADLHFAPTERARQALLREGFPEDNIYVTGNTIVDALLEVSATEYDWSSGPLATISLTRRIVLITAHRRESFGEPMRRLCSAIRQLAELFSGEDIQFVFPVHLNPNVRQPVFQILDGLANVHLLEPLDYLSLVNLMKRSALILTDSGGIQEEAPTFGVPLLVMRDVTERPEGIEAGVAKLVGTKRECIVENAARLLRDPQACLKMVRKTNPYGDGKAAKKIVKTLIERGLGQ